MIAHPRPKLKLIEFHYDHTITYDSIDDWCKNGTSGYDKHQDLRCTHCGQSHFHINKFKDCTYTTAQLVFNKLTQTFKLGERVTNVRAHEFTCNVIVRNDFGYTYNRDELGGFHSLYRARKQTQYREWWRIRSSDDSHNRGLLPEHRDDCWWNPRYQHYTRGGGYRHIRTTQEKRMHDACQVDDNSPQIRGRRSKNSLPTVYDDIYVNMQRTWKVRKVRKQWMLNLDK